MIKNNRTRSLVTNGVLIAALILMIIPIYFMVAIAFRPTDEILEIPMKFFSFSFTLEHVQKVFAEVEIMKYVLNTVIITLIPIVTNLFFGSLAAYAFSKLQFKYRDLIFRLMILSLMIPGIILTVPVFIIILRFPLAGGNDLFGMGGIGFLNSFAGMILPGTITVFSVFFLRQFFMTIPNEFREAAKMDGASEFQVYFHIYLPLIKPGLITLAVFSFQGAWNSFMWPNLVLSPGSPMAPLALKLQEYVSSMNLDYGPMMAITMVMNFFPFVLFLFLQKYYMKGIAVNLK